MDKALEIIQNKTALVLSGGGTLGLGEIGSLSKLHEYGFDLKKIKSVSGSSVGSIIATAIACGATIEYMKKKMSSINFQKLKNHDSLLADGINLLKDFGMHDMKEVRNLISEILIDLVGDKDITFRQLFNRRGIWLTVTYLSFNYERTIFADHVYEPNASIREAVVKSSAMPIFYEAYFEGKGKTREVIGDGGILLNLPFQIPHLQKYSPIEILGLKFISKGDKNVKDEGQPGAPEEDIGGPRNIIQFLYSLIQISRKQAMKVHVNENDWMNTVKINVGSLSSTDFEMSEENKDWLFKQGELGTEKYLKDLASLIENGKYPYL